MTSSEQTGAINIDIKIVLVLRRSRDQPSSVLNMGGQHFKKRGQV